MYFVGSGTLAVITYSGEEVKKHVIYHAGNIKLLKILNSNVFSSHVVRYVTSRTELTLASPLWFIQALRDP